jgi:hypothetical protein
MLGKALSCHSQLIQPDTLTGAGGRDIFDYGFKNAGNDIINDFTVGNIGMNANADIIDLRDLYQLLS